VSGGLLASTLLASVVVPALYGWFEEKNTGAQKQEEYKEVEARVTV
jgi:Cu/Ag efflux pump CusA